MSPHPRDGGEKAGIVGRPERWLPVQVIAAAVALTLGVWGYRLDGGSWPHDLYRAVALFAGDTTTLGMERGLVTVARWLALAVTASAVVAVTLAVLGRRAEGMMTRSVVRNHIVVAGNGRGAARVARGMATGGTRVVLVSDGPAADELPRGRVSVVRGSPTSGRSLRAAHVERAAVVVVAMDDDAETTHVALVAAGATSRGRVLGLLRDPVTRSHLQERILNAGGRIVELLALPEIAAREATARLPPFTPEARTAAIVGAGPLAEALAVEVARAAASDGAGRPRLVVDGFTPARLARLTGLADRLEVVVVGAEGPNAGERLAASDGESRCYLCPPASIGDLLALADAGGPATRVLLLVDEGSEEVARAAAETLKAIGDERLGLLDVNVGIHPAGLLSYGAIEEIARAKHAQYLRDTPAEHVSAAAGRPWEQLGSDLQQANRDFARGIAEHLARTGRRLVPDPSLDARSEVAQVFSEDAIEELARAEHDRWMRDKRAAGWTHGRQRDDAHRVHPYLVPWEDLDEPTRDKDRQPMRDVGRILAAAGLRAERIGTFTLDEPRPTE